MRWIWGNERREVGDTSERLLPMPSRKVSIHVEPSERSLNRVDLPVAVVIQFLEMIVGQFRGLRIRRASRLTIMSWVVA